jgi:hypothetical protein
MPVALLLRLDFSPDGQFLAFGTEDGVAGLVTLPN